MVLKTIGIYKKLKKIILIGIFITKERNVVGHAR